MKLLSVGLARVMLSFDTNELNPGGKDVFRHLIPAIAAACNFKTYPKPGEDFSQGLKFLNGEFIKDDETTLQVNCTVFKDGIAADTFSNTNDSQEFLNAILRTLPAHGFFYSPEMVRRTFYNSQLNVRCDKLLNALNPRLGDFSERLSAAIGGTVFNFSAIEFWPDQSQVLKPVNFSFQQKLDDPLGSGRYWSQAALPTDRHLQFLNEFEALLSD
jgi:hypothetical protein